MLELTAASLFLFSSLAILSPATQPGMVAEQPVVIDLAPASSSTPSQLEAYVRQYFKDTPVLAEVARCESSFRQFGADGKILRGEENAQDVGVMQINEHYHKQTATQMGLNLNNLSDNLAYAERLYEKYGTDPWSASSKCWNKTAASPIASK